MIIDRQNVYSISKTIAIIHTHITDIRSYIRVCAFHIFFFLACLCIVYFKLMYKEEKTRYSIHFVI